MSASPAVRSLRAAVFAAVCVLLAAAGHGFATGDMPPVWVDDAGFVGVFLAGWLLGGRERSLPGIGAVMLATQAGLHIAFDVVQPHAAVSAHGTRPASMGSHADAAVGHAHGLFAPASDALAHVHEMSTPVTAAHLLAALVASWWLRRGEVALWSLLRRAATLVPSLAVVRWRGARVPLPAPPGGPVRTHAEAVPLRQLLLRHAVRRRGPPAWIPYTI
ncbi:MULTISPECIES: hypothetical protein [Streptomyces]|uniref:hypothetical protein n=1 Tax=Streptomyces TaxID=1883 RepID=UPI00292F7C5D|nr:hypothetical protein [Streptomyces sp. NEAU-HV9]